MKFINKLINNFRYGNSLPELPDDVCDLIKNKVYKSDDIILELLLLYGINIKIKVNV